MSTTTKRLSITQPNGLLCVFTRSSWNSTCNITVTAKDDNKDKSSNAAGGIHHHEFQNLDTPLHTLPVGILQHRNMSLIHEFSPPRTEIPEDGSKQFKFWLKAPFAPPSGESYQIAITSSDSAFTVSPATVSIGANYTPQAVRVTAVDDDIDNAENRTANITFTCTGPCTDYPAVTVPAAVTVTAVDDNVKAVTTSPTALTMPEGGTQVRYDVTLGSRPTGQVTVAVAGTEGVVTVQPKQLTFTTGNWKTAQSVWAAPVNDQLDNTPDRTGTITHSASGADYADLETVVNVTLTDDETRGLSFYSHSGRSKLSSGDNIDITEGGTAKYNVELASEPEADVTVTPTSADTSKITLSPATLTFTPDNWRTAQTVTLTSIRDDIDQSIGLVGVKHAVKGGDYDALSGTTIGLNVQPQDVDVPGLTLSKSSLSLTEGATDGKQTSNYKLKLNSKPKAADNPTITPTADASVATVSPATLTFTQDDWNTPKTVTVTAVDDEVSQARSKKATAVSHAVAGYYIASSEVVPSVAVTVTDDEAAQTTYRLHKDDGQFGEQRNSERRLTVVRSGDTSEAVTLEIAGINRNVPGNATHGRNGDWNLLDSGTTFSAGSATTDFRVELFQDEMVELEEKMIFRLGMSAELASVIEDDDTPALSPSRQDIGIYSVSGYAAVASRSGTWTVRLGKKPQDSVVVDLSIASTCVDMTNCNPAAVTISPTSLTFGPNNWNRPKTVTVAAAAVDSSTYIPVGETRVAEVVHTASGSGYDRAPDKRVRVQVTSPQASGQGGSPNMAGGSKRRRRGPGECHLHPLAAELEHEDGLLLCARGRQPYRRRGPSRRRLLRRPLLPGRSGRAAARHHYAGCRRGVEELLHTAA